MYQFAIIGCGRIAKRHAENILKVGKLLAVCDAVKEKADDFAGTYGVKAFYSVEDLLDQVKDADIVSVCTPNGFHAEHSIKALQAGKHVLCEKPMCLSTDSAMQMIEAAGRCNRKLFVVKSARFNPLLKDLKRLIGAGELGRVYSYQLSCFWNRPKAYFNDWHGKLFLDGGTLYTQFSHYIDTLFWLFGEVSDVCGFMDNQAHQNAIEFEDTGVVAVKMKNGILGTINWSVNTFKKNTGISLTVIAENGTIEFGGEYMNEIRHQQMGTAFRFQQPQTGSDYSAYKSTLSHHREVYENLIEALNNNDHPFANAYDGLKTVEIIEKIYKTVSSPLRKQT